MEGRGDELRSLISGFLPLIESSDGCRSCQMLQSTQDPHRLVVIEVWDSVEAHQAAAAAIPPDAMDAAMKLLATPPQGDYYSG